MLSANIEDCFDQISAYFNGKHTGYFLVVNTNNYDDYQEILLRLQADNQKKCIYASENLQPNGIPDIGSVISKGSHLGENILIGISQTMMLRSKNVLERTIGEILEQSVQGYGVVLLDHCAQILRDYMKKDIRIQNRVILLDDQESQLPQIKLMKEPMVYGVHSSSMELPRMFAYLEKMRDLEAACTVAVVTQLPSTIFQEAVYSVSEAEGIYELLSAQYSDIAGATEKSYGTDVQWGWLAEQLRSHQNFSALICATFGATTNLSIHLSSVIESNDKNQKWLLWLAMKVFDEPNNMYLSKVLKKSEAVDDFEEHFYFEFVDVDADDPNFGRLFQERKRLLQQLPENCTLIAKYCEKLGRRQKDAVYYLTDESDTERYTFMRCFSLYEYSEKEWRRAVSGMSRALTLYMKKFSFDSVNTKLPKDDDAFRQELTQYFEDYKVQKLMNRIDPKFLALVDQYAVSRPYNKLQPRSSIISHMNKKGMRLFFVDALGVEYLAFILAKCEEYGLVADVSIGHCELPSITVKNKEFLQYFSEGNWVKVDALDEIKHHSHIYNYQQCEYPFHLFEELEIIDEQLRNIQSLLMQKSIEKALIVSDHGASRLAVRYGHEVEASIVLDEAGQHSGRCCPTEEDPHLPVAAYEDGFSVLANYERFKGGRKANLEVHGGASLEETLVPVIVLTKKPENLEICFVNPTIILAPHVIPELILYSNIQMQKPRLHIGDEFLDGEFTVDRNHAKFCLPKLKRKGIYQADVYDGETRLSVVLEFRVQKQTREVELF